MKDFEKNRENNFKLIERWQSSGKSAGEFCKQENLSYHKFHYWRTKYHHQNNIGSDFIKIKATSRVPHEGIYCELHFTSGIRLLFNQKPEAAYIKQLL
jgi:hypothetical protein